MASNRDQDLKEFLISERKKTSSGISVAPVWVIQKSNKRPFNTRQSRHWSQTDFGSRFRSRKLKEKRGF